MVTVSIVSTANYFKFLKEEFIPYLKQWKDSVENRKGFTKAHKKRMMLSQETLDGIHMTSKYFH